MEPKCIHCAIYKQNGNKCPIFAMDVSTKRGCPLYTERLDPCDTCGNHIIGTKTWHERDDGFVQLCEKCEAAISQNKCQICYSGGYCAFQQDTSCTLPPYITVQQRQGNAVIQMQQKNPERIKQTCSKCGCYKNEFCLREIGGCDNFTWRTK